MIAYAPIIIPIHSGGGSGKFTEQDLKVFIAFMIVSNSFWIISLFITLLKNNFNFEKLIYDRSDTLGMLLDVFMVIIWGLTILIYLIYLVFKIL